MRKLLGTGVLEQMLYEVAVEDRMERQLARSLFEMQETRDQADRCSLAARVGDPESVRGRQARGLEASLNGQRLHLCKMQSINIRKHKHLRKPSLKVYQIS